MDNNAAATAIAIIAAYLMGAFPTAYIVARLRKGIDIREVGSKNMGATNVLYEVGIPEGLFVFCVDVGKGAAAVMLARWLGTAYTVQMAAGGISVVGHAFPVFLKFRGGKGAGACLGALGALMPWGIPYYFGLFVVLLLISRTTTLSYGAALLSVPFMAWLLYDSSELIIFVVVMLALLITRYIPRMKEMYSTTGSWRGAIFRRSLKERY
ncbi:MAG: glycerol-3-phosphate acyltransferase [Dehalococcoidia bacterium]|nr:MAG: glycerol-3-phosphate acyltransferase [Dehalococcoidia bacterium]UCG83416.1 MAG: glycerol-3-phosphate acyltransferase [Dehalococcoidia bacterium]